VGGAFPKGIFSPAASKKARSPPTGRGDLNVVFLEARHSLQLALRGWLRAREWTPVPTERCRVHAVLSGRLLQKQAGPEASWAATSGLGATDPSDIDLLHHIGFSGA